MNEEQAQNFGAYIRHTREAHGLNTRQFAEQAGIDRGGLTRLEQGKVQTPRPDTLCALALALDVPFADMFAQAGYTAPRDLPSVESYLRAKYDCLSKTETRAITEIVEKLVELHGWRRDDQEARMEPNPKLLN